MMPLIQNLDVTISHFINTLIPHNQLFDTVASFLSLQANYLVIWFVVVGVLFFYEELRNKRFIGFFSLSFVITIFLVDVILKNIFHRARPLLDPQFHSTFTCPTDYSFPSVHASTAFAVAVILAHFDKKHWYLYYLVAVLISLSRIYLQCHYFLDVVAGALIGAAISHTILFLDKKKNKSTKRRRSSHH